VRTILCISLLVTTMTRNVMFVFVEIGNTISNLFGGSSKVEDSDESKEVEVNF